MNYSLHIVSLAPTAVLALAAPAHADIGSVELPRLGLVVSDVTPALARQADLDQVKGCVVQSVAVGSPAATAEVQIGDIIVSLNNRGIRNARELANDIAGIRPGEVAKMCVVRDDFRTTLYIAPGERVPSSAPARAAWLGVDVVDISEGSLESALVEEVGKEGGVVIRRVVPHSPAERAGFEPGDVIMSFNSRKVRTVRELASDLAGSRPDDEVRICIIRGEIRKTLYPVLGSAGTSALALTAGERILGEEHPLRNRLATLFPDATDFSRTLQPVPS